MPKQSFAVNVHDAVVRTVRPIGEDWPADKFLIKFGDNDYSDVLTFFTSDEQWQKIVATVAAARAESVPA